MTFQIFRRLGLFGRRWYWRLRAGNGEIIAVGGEGFHNLVDVKNIVAQIQRNGPVADVEVQDA